MKRFTETDKWRDVWFRKLTPTQKCLWSYLTDNCDHAGVIDVDWELASFQIGTDVSESDLAAFTRQLTKLPSGKYWLTGFVRFQYGRLSQECKPHAPVFAALLRHGIAVEAALRNTNTEVSEDGPSKGMPKPIERFQVGFESLQDNTRQDKEKDKDRDRTISGAGADRRHAHLPESLQTPAMAEAWDRWLVHWSTSFHGGRPMPEQTAHMQLRELVGMGPDGAIAAINNSISKGTLKKPFPPFQARGADTLPERKVTIISAA